MSRRSRFPLMLLAIILSAALSGSTPNLRKTPPSASPDPFEPARRKIAQILKGSGASGVAVAVAKDGKIVWEEGFGSIRRDGGSAVTPDTMFSLASITKPMTATGLMVLTERGLIDLDKPANDYLGEGKLTGCIEGAPAATVRNLVYHTSGLPMHWHFFYADNPQRAPGMDESIRRYGLLVRPPGEAYEYSNFGYGILGHILARVSGKTYADFMKKEVFEPLGMTRTMILTEPGRVDNAAAKYDAAKKELPVSDFDHQGASAAYASAHDLARFGMFRLGDEIPGQKRILKGETLSAMRTQSGSEFLDGSTPVKNLLGSFARIDHLGAGFLAATGGMPGAVSRLDIIPSKRIVSAVLANSDSVDLWALQHEIFAAYLPAFRDAPDAPPQAAASTPKEKFEPPDAIVGVWKGSIRTGQKSIPAAMSILHGGDVALVIDVHKYAPLSVRTELGDMSFKDGVFNGLFWGRIDTPDTAGLSHAVFLSLKLRANRLTGSASAVSIDSRRTFCLPHWMDLSK